jgi:hypothetical protein
MYNENILSSFTKSTMFIRAGTESPWEEEEEEEEVLRTPVMMYGGSVVGDDMVNGCG